MIEFGLWGHSTILILNIRVYAREKVHTLFFFPFATAIHFGFRSRSKHRGLIFILSASTRSKKSRHKPKLPSEATQALQDPHVMPIRPGKSEWQPWNKSPALPYPSRT